MPLTPVSVCLFWCHPVSPSGCVLCSSSPLLLVAVPAILLGLEVANSYFKITFIMTVFPCLPYKLMQQISFLVQCMRGWGFAGFFPYAFSINFGLSFESLELYLVFVGSRSGSRELKLHHKVEIFFNCLLHL